MTPKKLLQLDAFGALVSAFLLGIVLATYNHLIGMPKIDLYILASIPILFLLFDLYSLFIVKTKLHNNLRIIAYCNLAYCILSIGFLFIHYGDLSVLGWIYFIGEILIVFSLALYEIKASSI
jgi:hypothetical protein